MTTSNIIAAYLVIGAALISATIYASLKDPDCAELIQQMRDEYHDMTVSRGSGFASCLMLVVIIVCVLAWPYVLFGSKRS